MNSIHMGFETNDGISVPVVMRADMTIAGDQSRWKALTCAAVPVACGHAMDVPDSMLYRTFFLSGSPAAGDMGDHEAMMSTPGADMSGCSFHTPYI
jgi:hypothetical protein